MEDLTPNRKDLDPIEIASRDEISALQLERMKATLAHAYANSPFYRKSFNAHGVHPEFLLVEDCAVAEDDLLLFVALDRAGHLALGDIEHLGELRGFEGRVFLQEF